MSATILCDHGGCTYNNKAEKEPGCLLHEIQIDADGKCATRHDYKKSPLPPEATEPGIVKIEIGGKKGGK